MRTRAALTVAVAAALAVSGCGGGADPDDADPVGASDDGTTTEGSASDETAADEASAGAEADVAVAETDLGEVLVDGEGMTLYLFTPDPEGESTCEDDCAAAWPPLVVDGEPAAGDGVDPQLLGTLERSDGSTQVSYAGAPLYTWASDREPGDVTGQGVQDVWYVVAPDGEAVTDAPTEATEDAAGQSDDTDDPGY